MTSIAEFVENNTATPVVVTDSEGLILDINGCFEEVFGWQKSEIIGQHVTIILPENFVDSHHLAFSRFQLTEQSTILNHPLKLKAITKDGKEILSEHFIVAEKIGSTWSFAACLRPL
ncbi:MAG: PAS domain S-box protein [Synechococcus sp.]|nr:PAS domain S-box protein [Synechococcus sp.]